MRSLIIYFFWGGGGSPQWARASSFTRFLYHTTTHHSRQDSSGRVISSSQRPLPDNTQHPQQTDIHNQGGIRTHRLSRRAAPDLCLRQRGHWDRLNNLYYSPNIIRVINSRRMSWVGHVARMGKRRDAYRVLVGKTEGKKPLGRSRRRWGVNMKVDLLEQIDLAQNRDRWRTPVNAGMHLRVPQKAGNILTI